MFEWVFKLSLLKPKREYRRWKLQRSTTQPNPRTVFLIGRIDSSRFDLTRTFQERIRDVNCGILVVKIYIFWKFTAVHAASFTPPYLTSYISYLWLLFVSFMSSLKTKFPGWNDFQFCLTARQTDRQTGSKIIISLLSAHVRLRQIQSQSTAKLQVRFPIHVLIRV